jgi:hypothetical protein
MLTRTQALEGGANVTCISKVQFAYRSFIRLTILGHYATAVQGLRFYLFVQSYYQGVTTMRPRGLSDSLVPAPGRTSSVARERKGMSHGTGRSIRD